MKVFYFLLFTFYCCNINAQYAPQAGLPGSTAISASSSVFTAWATQCSVQRGFMDIANPSLGYASSGDSSLATGAPDGAVVSLGDSGIAVLTFANPIYNGPGPDFAVFENGFRNPADSSQAFLELAFVEVSSDGINYFRFPSSSLTQDQVQIGNGDYLTASNLNNLAGSYVAMYGTPFDLQELSGISGLDINNITHVRLIDVVGSVSGHSSHDNAGRIINDPYPTPYPSSGFDLDAVGVIHEVVSVKSIQNNVSLVVYPNPATDNIIISIKGNMPAGLSATLTSITGNILQQLTLSQTVNTIPIEQYPAGMYYLVLYDVNGNKWVEKLTKH
ncbi:MAG: T9SS type A sorting domain-containing protein [Chitinophagales bacterium]